MKALAAWGRLGMNSCMMCGKEFQDHHTCLGATYNLKGGPMTEPAKVEREAVMISITTREFNRIANESAIMHDLHYALGIRFGDNPYLKIKDLLSKASAYDRLLEITKEADYLLAIERTMQEEEWRKEFAAFKAQQDKS